MNVDQAVLTEVLDHFNLLFPVTVWETAPSPASFGCYKGVLHYGQQYRVKPPFRCMYEQKPDWPSHTILLGSDLSRYQATETFIHELTHAHQNERFIPADYQQWPNDLGTSRWLATMINEQFKGTYLKFSGSPHLAGTIPPNYQQNPMEIEAKEVSERLTAQLKKLVFTWH